MSSMLDYHTPHLSLPAQGHGEGPVLMLPQLNGQCFVQGCRNLLHNSHQLPANCLTPRQSRSVASQQLETTTNSNTMRYMKDIPDSHPLG
jgi:hypothetical protein